MTAARVKNKFEKNRKRKETDFISQYKIVLTRIFRKTFMQIETVERTVNRKEGNEKISRLFLFLILPAILTGLFILTGCSSIQKRKYLVAGPIVSEKVHLFEDFWEDQGPFKPDDPNLPLRRGKAGVIRFFKEGNSSKSICVDGSLTVYVFEGVSEGVQLTKPIAKSVYTSEQLEKQRKYDSKIGYSYHVWLDLGELDQPEEEISILSVFTDSKSKEQTTSKVIRTTIYGNPNKGSVKTAKSGRSFKGSDRLFNDEKWKEQMKQDLAQKSGRYKEGSGSDNDASENRTVTTIDLSDNEALRYKNEKPINEMPSANGGQTDTERRESLNHYLSWQETQRQSQYEVEKIKAAESVKTNGNVSVRSNNALMMNDPSFGSALVAGNVGGRVPAMSIRSNTSNLSVPQNQIENQIRNRIGQRNQPNSLTVSTQEGFSQSPQVNQSSTVDQTQMNAQIQSANASFLQRNTQVPLISTQNQIISQASYSTNCSAAENVNNRPARYTLNDVHQLVSGQNGPGLSGSNGVNPQLQAGFQSVQPLAPKKGFVQSTQQDRLNELFRSEQDSSLQTEVLLTPPVR